MQLGKSVVILAGTALYILWLVVLALSVVVHRRCKHWLMGRCLWDPWYNRAPC
jgi:hypothetical protein